MKKKLINGLAVGVLAVSFSCASAADLVAQWNDFSNLSSGDYLLTTSGSTTVDENGVLNVVGASGGTANVDLTSAALSLNTGLTISAKISNIGSFSGIGPFSVFAFATNASTFAALVGYNSGNNNINFALNGGTGNITSTATASASALKNNTPVILTATFTTSSFKVYLNGEEVATGTPGTNKITATQAGSTITKLSLGSWAGASTNGLLSEKVYNLAVYKGAMTASDVKSLVAPEPATATLSLLALAALAARRRRK